MSLSKNHLKLITSLSQKKYRQKHKLFVVEGLKTVQEFLNSTHELVWLFTEDVDVFAEQDPAKVVEVSKDELQKISQLKTPNTVLALFAIPDIQKTDTQGLIVALDDVNDPGNLGTIIRLCDWFGVTQLWCSPQTVDCYNAKVVQASMGSLSRVSIIYHDLDFLLNQTEAPVFIADMDGENVYTAQLPKQAILVMGNEANGVSVALRSRIKNRLTIPRYGVQNKTESLNVATATGILLSEFRR